jgi:hypothetical protein
MKRIVLSFFLFTSLAANAQKIDVQKGQTISIVAISDQDIDMSGMGMNMKNKSSLTSVVEIKDVNKENIEANYTLKKIKVTMDMMGQETNYDSENPADKDSELGKNFGESVGKKVKISINKTSGLASLEDKDDQQAEKDDNPLSSIMTSLGSGDEDATVQSVFFIIPQGKKIGDTWSDSTSANGMKEVKKFTFQSLSNNIANILLESTLAGSNTIENQGMQMELKIFSKSKGDILVDTKTSMVKKRSSTIDLDGTIGVMGQSMPVSSKATVVVEYL